MAIRVYRVAVVGCPRAVITDDGSFEGVGKSSLCNRFVRPEAYSERHASVVSEGEWLNGAVFNGDHFIYWGAANKNLADGTRVRFQVVEQSEFYEQAVDGKLCSHPSKEDYLSRASAVYLSSRSGGKVAYRLQAQEDAIARRRVKGPIRATQLFPTAEFTAGKGHGIHGYVVVFDPSLEDERMQRQLSYLSELLLLLAKKKRKIVIACVKCDAVEPLKIRFGSNLSAYALKKTVPFVEVSSKEGVNVDDAFCSLISPPKKSRQRNRRSFSGYFSYSEKMDLRKGDLSRAKDMYRKLLQQKVTDFSSVWQTTGPLLEKEPEHVHLRHVGGGEGEELVKQLFCLRLIELKLTEASRAKGFNTVRLDKQQSRSYQQHLAEAFRGHPDIGSYSEMYDYIYTGSSSSTPSEDTSSEVPSTPSFSSYRETPDFLMSPSRLSSASNVFPAPTPPGRPRSATVPDALEGNRQLLRTENGTSSLSPSARKPSLDILLSSGGKSLSLPRSPLPTVEVQSPPPLPPRDADFNTLRKSEHTASQPFLDGTAKLPGTLKRDGEASRLSSSMDCLLVPEDDQLQRTASGGSYQLAEAEPYLQPLEVLKEANLPLPQRADSDNRNSSIFMSVRVVGSKSRPSIPQFDEPPQSPLLTRSKSVRGHKRSRSNPWILENLHRPSITSLQSDSSEVPPPVPPRNTPKHRPSKTPPPSLLEDCKSPIESSLDFSKDAHHRTLPPPLPPPPSTSLTRSPKDIVRKLKEHSQRCDDDDALSDISGPFEEIDDAEKRLTEVSILEATMLFADRTCSPSESSLAASTLSKREISASTLPRAEDDDDDSSFSHYAEIGEIQQYIAMAPLELGVAATLPQLKSHTDGEEPETKRHSKSMSQVGMPSTPKKEMPVNVSAPILPWKRKWKKPHRTEPPISESLESSPPPPPSHAINSHTLPSPYKRRKGQSATILEPRPLPPSPTKGLRGASDKLSKKVSSGSNIYEVIDEDLINKVKGTWAPPVDPEFWTQYLEVVQKFFSDPEIREKWADTVKSVMTELDYEDILPPYYTVSPSFAEEEEEEEEEEGHHSPVSSSSSPVVVGAQSRRSSAFSKVSSASSSPRSKDKADDERIPIICSASPHLTPVSSPPFSMRLVPTQQQPSPLSKPRTSALAIKRTPSREDVIEMMNKHLLNENSSSDSEDSDSSDSDSDSESDSGEEAPVVEKRPPPPPVIKPKPKRPPRHVTDLDAAIRMRNSVSTDSDLVETDSAIVVQSPQSTSLEEVNSSEQSSCVPSPPSHEESNVKPSRLFQKRREETLSKRSSDSGISNCHSQNLEDVFNNTSEC